MRDNLVSRYVKNLLNDVPCSDTALQLPNDDGRDKIETRRPVNISQRDHDASASAAMKESLAVEMDDGDLFLSLFSDSSSVSDE